MLITNSVPSMDKEGKQQDKNYWIESGMESDVAPDEMYLMLQADMLSIKRQEKALQSEIAEIKSKFVSLVETCGIQHSDYPIKETSSVTSPSFMYSNSCSVPEMNRLSRLEDDEDFLLQQLLQGSIGSSSSESIYDDSAMTLIVDDNSNYKSTPSQPQNTMISLASMVVPNITEPVSSSDISNGSSHGTTSSDGYPKSTETSSDTDNQCVPCLDFEEELASRTKYYSDFTIDRQRKINNMSPPVSNASEPSRCSELSDEGSEDISTREVEGCEAKDLPAFRAAPLGGSVINDSRVIVYNRTTSRSASGTDNSLPSPPLYNRKSHSSGSSIRSSSSSGSRKSNSIPQASSTMIEDFSQQSSHSSGSSRHRSSNSIPQASSTMIEGLPSSKGSSRCSSHEDFVSVYTWSINDTSDDVCIEDSYMRNIVHKTVERPSRPSSRRSSSASSSSSRRSSKRDRDSNRIHHVLTEPDSVLGNSLSVIEHVSDIRDAYVGADSLYEDEDLHYKASTLPRTSTRLNLLSNKSSGSSSLECRRSSMPDILSVCTPNDFHSVPTSDDEDDNSANDSSPLQERTALPGKSSSSGCTSSPLENTRVDCAAPNNTDALIDSILTDSPVSVGSSGIAAPYNSYNSPVDSHPASRTSQSTTSDNKSESSVNQPSAPPSSVLSSPVAESKPDPIFKKPINTQPLRKLFKFKRSKGKSSEKILSSTPNHGYPSSVRSDPVSKRKLFLGSNKMQDIQLMDKKAVIKKFRKFSESFHKRDPSSVEKIQTLANL